MAHAQTLGAVRRVFSNWGVQVLEVAVELEALAGRCRLAGWAGRRISTCGQQNQHCSEPVDIPVVDSAGTAFRHIVPSREECNVCHQASPGFVLGFSEIQLNHQLPGHSSTQFSRLIESGTLSGFAGGPVAKVTDPDESTRLVKGYVQGNCVQCHNGGVAIDFGHETFLQNTL